MKETLHISDYQTAVVCRNKQDWVQAGAHFLQVLVNRDPEYKEACKALEEITQESGSPYVRACWGAALTILGEWVQAEDVLSPFPDCPLSLSDKITTRWPEMNAKSGGHTFPAWIQLLRFLDRVLSLGFPAEALLMCQSGISHIQDHTKRAIVFFEAGRLGILHRQVSLGVSLMRTALSFEPSVRPQARAIVDQALVQQRVEGDDLEDLFLLRLHHVDSIQEWAISLVENAPITQRFALAHRMAMCAEYQVEHEETAFFFYALAMEHAHKPELVKVILEGMSRVCLDAHRKMTLNDEEWYTDDLGRMVELSIEEREATLVHCLESHLFWDQLFQYYTTKAKLLHNFDEKYKALNQSAMIASSHLKDFELTYQIFKDIFEIHPKSKILSTVIRQAREHQAWSPLDRLLTLQLKQTKATKRQQAILRIQAQVRLSLKKPFKAYQALNQARELGETPDVLRELQDLVNKPKYKDQLEHLFVNELGDDATSWWVFFAPYHQLFINDTDYYLLLATRSLARFPHHWPLIERTLSFLEEHQEYEQWVHWVATISTDNWISNDNPQLIQKAIQISQEYEFDYTPSLLRLQAHILDARDDIQASVDAWGHYLDIEPQDREALEAFAQKATELGRWTDLANRYENALPLRKTGRVHLLELLAQLYTEHLEDEDKALISWLGILDIKSNHTRAGEQATLILNKQQNWVRVLEVCEQWKPADPFHPTFIESQLRAYLELGDLHTASSFLNLLSEERTKRLFIPLLLEKAQEARQGSLILDLLEQDQHTYEDHIELERLKLKAYTLYKLVPDSDLLELMTLWERILKEDPNDLQSKRALIQIYTQLGKRKSLTDLLDHLIESFEDGDLQQNYRLMISGIQHVETRFELGRKAFDYWLSLVQICPTPQCLQTALSSLERIAYRFKLWTHLDEVWTQFAQFIDHPARMQELYIKRAKINLIQLQNWEDAFELSNLIETMDPDHPELKALYSELVFPLNLWELLTEKWLEWGHKSHAETHRFFWLKRVALVYEQRLERKMDAYHLYKQIASWSDEYAQSVHVDLNRLGQKITLH